MVTGTPNVSEDSATTSGNPESDAKNTLNKRINYSIFGLTALSLILCMVYLYTRSLEKTSSENKHCITNYTHKTLIFESHEHDLNTTF